MLESLKMWPLLNGYRGRPPVNVAALTIFAQSVFGVAIAALWLGEKLHWGQLLGSLTIVAGLALGLSRQIKGPAPREATP